MEKFSVIVPTMWRCPDLFNKLLNEIVQNRLVDEILIINNDVNNTPDWPILNNSAIILLNQDKNIGPDQGWALGIKLSKNNLICICSDDIYFDNLLFTKIQSYIIPENGVFGIDGNNRYKNGNEINFQKLDIPASVYEYGQLMFFYKTNFIGFPSELFYYFFDTMLFDSHTYRGFNNYVIINSNFQAKNHVTINLIGDNNSKFSSELIFYRKWLKENFNTEKTSIHFG